MKLDRITILSAGGESDVRVDRGWLSTNGVYASVAIPESDLDSTDLVGSQIVCSQDGTVVYSGDEILSVHTQFHAHGYRVVLSCRPGDADHRATGNPALAP